MDPLDMEITQPDSTPEWNLQQSSSNPHLSSSLLPFFALPDEIPSSYHEETALQIVLTTALFLLLLGGTLCNGIVFLLFYRKPTVRTFSNRFVLNLTATHLVTSVLVVPIVLVTSVAKTWIFGSILCQITGVVTVCLSVTTVLSLLLIAVDRNCAVNSPLHYSMTITKTRTGAFITSIWIFAFVISLPPLVGVGRIEYQEDWNTCIIVWPSGDPLAISYAFFMCASGFLLPFVKLSWMYGAMFRAARSNTARTRKHSLSPTGHFPMRFPEIEITHPHLHACAVNLSKRKQQKMQQLRRSSSSSTSSFFGEGWKAARTGLLVVFTFALSWFPYFGCMVLYSQISKENWLPSFVPALITVLTLSSCVINPYIYVFRNKTTWKHAKRLLWCFSKNRNQRLILKYTCDRQHMNGFRPPPPRHCKTPPVFRSIPIGDNQKSMDINSILTGGAPILYQDKAGNWQIVATVDNMPTVSTTQDSSCRTSEALLDSASDDESSWKESYPTTPRKLSNARLLNYLANQNSDSQDTTDDGVFGVEDSFKPEARTLCLRRQSSSIKEDTDEETGGVMYTFQNSRLQRQSSGESTDNNCGVASSFDSGLGGTEDSVSLYSLMSHRKDSLTERELANSSYPSYTHSKQRRPSLKSMRSFLVDEHELNFVPVHQIKYNVSGRRNSFATFRQTSVGSRSESMEQDFGSRSVPSKSSDIPVLPNLSSAKVFRNLSGHSRSRPKLIRQHSSIAQYAAYEWKSRTDSGLGDSFSNSVDSGVLKTSVPSDQYCLKYNKVYDPQVKQVTFAET